MGGKGLEPAGSDADIAETYLGTRRIEISTNPIDFLLLCSLMQSRVIKWTMSGFAAVLLLAGVLTGCGGQSSASESGGDGSGGKLTLVAYSTPEEA